MLRLRDTLSGEKRPFAPIGDEVRLYVCGITPYSEAHLGHALFSIVFDVLRRYLEWRGHRVRHIQNFTDIDDKLIERANATGASVAELAERHSEAYLAQLTRLNVLPATAYPRATEEMPRIVAFIKTLVAKGAAYPSGGDVYFRVRARPDYGKLSGRAIEDLRSGARVDPGELKDDPLDFALWKGAKPGEPSWESPWGPGRPGWHIECSAMAVGALGERIDIHGGGADLIFPHHENEIAQSESGTGKAPFARFWVHNALLRLEDEKMSKSSGHLVGIDEALDWYGADALRMFILTSHYRSPLTYGADALESARAGAERLRQAAFATGTGAGADGALDPSAYRERFVEAMDDDLNTPRALAALFDLARAVNRAHDGGGDAGRARAELRELAGVLGFALHEPPPRAHPPEPFVDLLVGLRAELREVRQWALADRVRDGLTALGVELRDGPDGTDWSFR